MKNLSNPFWIKLKAVLFLFIGIISASLIFLNDPKWQTAVLLALVIWSFCRCYYFAFYVIEKYVDPSYKFSGLFAFARYLWRGKS